MNYIDINEEALNLLSKENFTQAQKLFFQNAKSTQSHETYNNLGWYLYTEGLECKNGKVRNAEKLGLHYLLKAKKIKDTSVNLNNIASVIEGQRNYTYCQTGVENIELCRTAYQYTDQAVKLKYSNEAEYNRLRFLYLCDSRNTEVLSGLKKLSEQFKEPICIEFLLNILCIHAKFHECLELIPQYQNELDEICLMSMYCLCGEFEKGAGLCDRIYEKYVLTPEYIAMLANCLINSGQLKKAINVKSALKKDVDSKKKKAQEFCQKIDQIFDNVEYRMELIQSYQFMPPFLAMCGYFGCKLHATPFFENTPLHC